ncbi:MAG: ABC transporter ATP-binding protein [Bacteroidales bacterium]|nr:ABC transporter ATP-binding protein [Bacteroidales bacterium]
MSGFAIELVGLTKKYGSFTAVDHLNLSIKKGEVFGLLGPNGAGKSTTILMILGLTDPASGHARVCGIDPTVKPIEVKRLVGYLPEDVGFYDDRTGYDNLMYTARLNSIPDAEAQQRIVRLLERVGLSGEAGKKTGTYSRGMRQRLGLADVLIKNPEIIILDEPTLGIDPKGVREFLNLILELSKEEGLTVLFSSHHLHQVQQVCDRVGLFVKGKLLAEGNVQSLAQKLFTRSPYVIEAGISGNGESVKEIASLLKPINGVEEIALKDKYYEISCTRDATAEIAKEIVASGLSLTHLSRKEYGLDDIYYRYFEGGEEHERIN